MTVHAHTKIIAFVGLPGAGKSSAVEYLKTKHYPSVYFGGVILEAMREAGIEDTPLNEKMFRESIRETEGKDFVVNRIIKQIHDLIGAGQHRIIADGLYTWTEYKRLKHEFPGEIEVVAIVTPKHIRKQRLAKRPERPMTPQEVDERDWAEIENLEKGGPIAIADHYIINAGDLNTLHHEIDRTLEAVGF